MVARWSSRENAVISAPFHDSPLDGSPYFQVGEVFVYTKNGSWRLFKTSLRPIRHCGSFRTGFGTRWVHLAIGAQGDNQAEGAVYIFGNTDGTWVFEEKIVALIRPLRSIRESLALEGDTLRSVPEQTMIRARVPVPCISIHAVGAGLGHQTGRSGRGARLLRRIRRPRGRPIGRWDPRRYRHGYFSGSVTLSIAARGIGSEDKLAADGALYDGFGGKISLSERLCSHCGFGGGGSGAEWSCLRVHPSSGFVGPSAKSAPGEPADGWFGAISTWREIPWRWPVVQESRSASINGSGRMESRSPLTLLSIRQRFPSHSPAVSCSPIQGADTLQPETGAALIFSLALLPSATGTAPALAKRV